jgi:hypothetical protein
MLFDLLEDDATNKDKLKRIKQIIDKWFVGTQYLWTP